MAKLKTEEVSMNDDLQIVQENAGEPAVQQPLVNESRESVVYCGPSLPRARIISMSVYRGGIPRNIEALIEKIPEVGRLIVPVSRLIEVRQKTATQGTEENRLYQVILSRRGEIENGI